MLTVIADIQVRAGAEHKQNVLNAFAKIIGQGRLIGEFVKGVEHDDP